MTDAQIVDQILAHEGGFINHPADRGGPTNFGITQTTLAQWRKQDVTEEDVQALSIDEARAIYQALYVRPFDGVDPRVKPHVVDIAVNSGVGRARVLLAKAEQQMDRPLPVQLVIERLEFYARLVQAKPSQAVFLTGWIRRACSFLVLMLMLSGCAHAIQPIPRDYTVPQQWARLGCRPRGEMFKGSPVLTCPDGLRMVSPTGQLERFVAWSEIQK